MHNRRYYNHYKVETKKFEEQIRTAVLKYSDERQAVSLEELERWVAEDKKRRKKV